MSGKSKLFLIKEILYVCFIGMLGCVGVIFAVLYIQTFSQGTVYTYSGMLTAVSVALVAVLTVLTLTFFKNSHSFIYKIFFLSTLAVVAVSVGLYLLKVSGFLDKMDSVEDFRVYVSSVGSWAIWLFILIQFLQVVVLPIPSFITVGAGVLLFGAFKGAVYSCLGIISGSIVAYLIGRIFGVKIAKWLVGAESLKKGLNAIRGKDKIILTFMFLFPFFPDDLLCFVAGVTTISPAFFVTMTIVTRIICIFTSSYSFNNSLIPYDTWWGILLWILFFVITIVLTFIIYNKGEKMEKLFFVKVKNKRKHK